MDNKKLDEIEKVDVLIYHAGGSGGIGLKEAEKNIDNLLKKVDKDFFIYLSSGPDYQNIGSKKGLKMTAGDYASLLYSRRNTRYKANLSGYGRRWNYTS